MVSIDKLCHLIRIVPVKTAKTQDLKEFLNDQGFKNLIGGHPWLWKKGISRPDLLPQRPGIVHLGEHWFLYSPQSQIALRRVGPYWRNWAWLEGSQKSKNYFYFEDPKSEDLSLFWKETESFLKQRLLSKIQLKVNKEDNCLRWLFSENDCCPGLVVDLFANTAVAQIQTAPIDFFWDSFKEVLTRILNEVWLPHIVTDSPIVWLEQRDHPFREQEGLSLLKNPTPEKFQSTEIRWKGLKWNVNPGLGQKTGQFLDQGLNHLKVSEWANKIGCQYFWDTFCFEGGFGLHLLTPNRKGIFVDSSETALEKTRSNIRLNFPTLQTHHLNFEKSDAFEFFKAQDAQLRSTSANSSERPDFIVLDPPSFARKKSEIPRALLGLKELNLRALRSLRTGGILVTCSCSHSIDEQSFLNMIRQTAHDARRFVKIYETLGPSPDHAPSPEFPEGRYLQTWVLGID